VLSTIAELGYYPNELARSLRVKQTLTVGLVIPDLLNPFYTGLAHSLEDICFGRGYVLIVCSTNREADKERRFAELLRAKQVDGVVFLPDSESMDAIGILREAHVPVVVLEHDIEGLSCIAIDDFRGGCLATEHLIGLGHRRIGFIQQQPNYTTSRRRLDGYQAVLQENDLTVEQSLLVSCESGPVGGAAAMATLLARRLDISAVVAHNDVIALGVIHAIRQAGLSVPHDISVVSYDDIASAAFYAPPLTTISYPVEAMAKSAARHLFGMMDANTQSVDLPGPSTELLPVHLIVRQSTAPVPRKDG
jgi:LacI family transcriptional regulator